MKKGKIIGVGIGPGDPDLITMKAVKAIKSADKIYIPKSNSQASTAMKIVSEYLPNSQHIESISFSMSKKIEERINSRKENAKIIEKDLNEGKTVVFITIGDAMLYSTFSYILEYIGEDYQIESIPGIYSFSAISGILNLPLTKGEDKLSVISNFDEKAVRIFENSDTIVCMKLVSYAKELYEFLSLNGNYDFVMVSEVGKDKQNVSDDINALNNELPYFTTAILKRRN
ncbi:MAG: precorrin-2 C(20)-methyltransferase [Marinifilaceae bacterium]|jgi:precorrin-2/cobalt-factor-2 C20-methyltransferase|nr:precorrin-2 C(20)-methyltransferase [Marinifilaceae bacterium]